MTTLTVPKLADAKAKISDYLAGLPLGLVSELRRAEILENCVVPIVLLIEAVQMAGAAGLEEEEVMIRFIRALYVQSETAKRERYFSGLMKRLGAQRPLA